VSGSADPAAASSGTWSVEPTPNPPITESGQLSGVACLSNAACVAAGSYTTASRQQHTLATPWNGSAWALQSPPAPSGARASQASAVSCPSTSLCTAVGSYVNGSGVTLTLAERWDGSSWAVQSTPNPSGAIVSVLSGVACPSTTLCSAIGNFVNSSGKRLALV